MKVRMMVFGAFDLLGRFFRPRPLHEVTSLTQVELKAKYRSLHRFGWLLPLVIFVGLGMGSGYGLGQLAEVFRPTDVKWLILTFFGLNWFYGFAVALTLTMPVQRLLLSRMFRANWTELRVYADNDVRLDVYKFMIVVLIPMFVFTATTGVLAMDNYTAFRADGIAFNPFWSLRQEEVHPYNTIAAIFEAQGYHARFKDILRPCHAIVFDDGTIWRTDFSWRDPLPQRDREFIEFAAKQSGKPIQRVDFIEQAVDFASRIKSKS